MGDRGRGARETRSSLGLLPTSSARGTQGRKLSHDRKIKKIQLLVYSLAKKPFSLAQQQR